MDLVPILVLAHPKEQTNLVTYLSSEFCPKTPSSYVCELFRETGLFAIQVDPIRSRTAIVNRIMNHNVDLSHLMHILYE